MFSAGLYSKLTPEERVLLDSYTERVAHCQGHSSPIGSQSLSAISVQGQRQGRGADAGGEGEKSWSVGELLSEESRVEKRAKSASRLKVPTIDELSKSGITPSKRTKPKTSSVKRTSRSYEPRYCCVHRKCASRPKKKVAINWAAFDNLGEEVEQLLKIVHSFARKNAGMRSTLESCGRLYSQYASAVALATKKR